MTKEKEYVVRCHFMSEGKTIQEVIDAYTLLLIQEEVI